MSQPTNDEFSQPSVMMKASNHGRLHKTLVLHLNKNNRCSSNNAIQIPQLPIPEGREEYMIYGYGDELRITLILYPPVDWVSEKFAERAVVEEEENDGMQSRNLGKPSAPSSAPKSYWNFSELILLILNYEISGVPQVVLSHLIKDCDYYEKKMAREAEVKKQRVFNTGNGVAKPVWTNANSVNHANKFVPRLVQLNAGRPNINSVRPNINTGRTNINSVRPNINTGRTNINSVRPNINSGRPNVNTGRTNVNSVRPKVNTGSSTINTVRSR
ncbi:hypothetical protein Tco_0550659 [Tanacetum coccineum]